MSDWLRVIRELNAPHRDESYRYLDIIAKLEDMQRKERENQENVKLQRIEYQLANRELGMIRAWDKLHSNVDLLNSVYGVATPSTSSLNQTPTQPPNIFTPQPAARARTQGISQASRQAAIQQATAAMHSMQLAPAFTGLGAAAQNPLVNRFQQQLAAAGPSQLSNTQPLNPKGQTSRAGLGLNKPLPPTPASPQRGLRRMPSFSSSSPATTNFFGPNYPRFKSASGANVSLGNLSPDVRGAVGRRTGKTDIKYAMSIAFGDRYYFIDDMDDAEDIVINDRGFVLNASANAFKQADARKVYRQGWVGSHVNFVRTKPGVTGSYGTTKSNVPINSSFLRFNAKPGVFDVRMEPSGLVHVDWLRKDGVEITSIREIAEFFDQF